MPAPQFDAVKEVTDAFTLLFKRRNWLLGGPTVAGTFIITAVLLIAMFIAVGPEILREIAGGKETPDVSPARIAAFAIAFTVGILLLIAVQMFTYAWTLVAAEPTWLGQDPAWDRGFNRAGTKLLTLFAYIILVALMSVVSLITIVGPIVIGVLQVYGPPFILFGNRSATQAIGDSFRLASENIAPTLIMVLAFIVVYVGSIIPTFILGLIPFFGIIVQLAFQWLLSAYVALTIVRFYDILSASSAAPPFPLVPETNV
jgi:hypothetical protein